ncbi:hypothetical protein T492DRAFT_847885 [Pavlovales sp. CCMP2436]|nr:hypothetical protein T492DRAFT_847885 [Pavlovales sp. CCMP2436]
MGHARAPAGRWVPQANQILDRPGGSAGSARAASARAAFARAAGGAARFRTRSPPLQPHTRVEEEASEVNAQAYRTRTCNDLEVLSVSTLAHLADRSLSRGWQGRAVQRVTKSLTERYRPRRGRRETRARPARDSRSTE